MTSVLSQTFDPDRFEVVVVNDSGRALPDAEWQRDRRVRVVETCQRERSVARNTGASLARGRYLHFLDDDDWMAPGALAAFWDAARLSDAVWLYGISQLVDRSDRPLIQLRHDLRGNCFAQVMAGEWIPLQSSLLEAATFFAVGGFNPRLAGPEDVDLLRRFALVGDVEDVPAVVATVEMGADGSSTDYTAHAQGSRWAREEILDDRHAFSRFLTSATSSYWRGRTVRVYSTSAVWNLRRHRWLTTIRRLARAGRAVGGSLRDLVVPDFWRALTRPYASVTFERGWAEVGQVHARTADHL